jgi:hypothetical protein
MSETPPSLDPPDLKRWVAALLLVATILGAYWKLVLTDQYTWLGGQDNVNQVLPWLQFQAREWHAGRIALWDPYHYGGQSLIGQAQPGAAYPLNWILFLLPLRQGYLSQNVLHWYFVVTHLLMAGFAYLLARELGCRRWAAVVGGVTFPLAGLLGRLDWPQMFNGATWIPLVLLALLRAARSETPIVPAALGGFALGLAWLSGHHQIPIFLSLAALGLWLWMLVRQRRLLLPCGAFWLMAAAAGALQILPAMEYGRLSVRWVGVPDAITWSEKVPYTVLTDYGLQPVSLLGILFPGMFINSDPFLGVTLFLLALAGVALAWRHWPARAMAAVALGGLIYSLSNYTALHGILYSLLPQVDKARSPSMAIVLFSLGAGMLAALGLDRLRDQPDSPWVPRLRNAALVFGALVFLLRLGLAKAKEFERRTDDGDLVIALAALLFALLLHGWKSRGLTWPALCAASLLLFLMESSNGGQSMLPHRSNEPALGLLKSLYAHNDIAQFLRQQPGLRRVQVDDKVIPYNFGDWHGVPQDGGYLASMPLNVRQHGFHTSAVQRLLGVAFAVGSQPTEFHKHDVFTGSSNLKVYANPDVLPRAFAVHEAFRIADRRGAGDHLSQLEPELGQKTFLDVDPPALERCPGNDEITIRSHAPGRVILDVNMACRGMVILADTYAPGWTATVDQQETPIYEAYTLVRGVVVPAGKHTINFVYRPRSVLAGAALTLAATLAALALAWRSRRAIL